MDVQSADVIALITNVGFPVTICFMLLRYVLQTMGEKLDKLDNSINTLIQIIGLIAKRDSESNHDMQNSDK